MERIVILSDYSAIESPNSLSIVYDEQGDVHIGLYESQEREGVRIAASGTRHSGRVRKAFWNLIQAYKEELADEHCHPHLRKKNGLSGEFGEGK